MSQPSPEYLGDAVYVSIDAGMLALHVNTHNNTPLVYLEPAVLLALCDYAVQHNLLDPTKIKQL